MPASEESDMNRRIITLLSDFGVRDHYVGAMKGVILSINPSINLVDISHSVPPQDIQSGAFTLAQACRWFPEHTIHLAVVDPGVGTSRKGLAVYSNGHYFVGPDNGLFSYILEQEGATAYEITADHYFCKPLSSTFHGRDVFAPVAAWMSRDVHINQLGPECKNPVRLKIPRVTKVKDTLIQAAVLAVDQFGNLVTNLRPEDIPNLKGQSSRPWKMLAGHREINAYHRTFAEANAGEVFVLAGSSGYLEIAVRNGSAASVLNLAAGAPIGVVMG
jgi:S-adenosyl-L-methionine hydrolase (adenosine-forming)